MVGVSTATAGPAARRTHGKQVAPSIDRSGKTAKHGPSSLSLTAPLRYVAPSERRIGVGGGMGWWLWCGRSDLLILLGFGIAWGGLSG
jgi:hypothetical protein